MDFNNKQLESTVEYNLSWAIDHIRSIIEPKSFRMMIRWSELDAHQTGMLGDMSAGTLAHSLSEVAAYNTNDSSDKTPPEPFHVLDESAAEKMASLKEQRKYREAIFKRKN